MMERRQFTPEFKTQTVLGVLTGAQSQAEVCGKHGLGSTLRATRESAFLERAHTIFDTDGGRTEEPARIAELERVLGRMTLENGRFPERGICKVEQSG